MGYSELALKGAEIFNKGLKSWCKAAGKGFSVETFQPALKNSENISLKYAPRQNGNLKNFNFNIDTEAENISKEIGDTINVHINKTITKTANDLPQSSLGWIKLFCKEKSDSLKEKITKCIKYIQTEKTVKKQSSNKILKSTKIAKSIPDELKVIFMELNGKSGKEFVDLAYQKMISYMNLKGIAPKSIIIRGESGLAKATGGYNPVTNTIEFSKGFVDNLTKEQQINLLSHELKHCEQFNNMLRTEGIGIKEYAKAIAENNVKNAINPSSFDNFMFRFKYNQALENGTGEEFLQKAIEKSTEKLIADIETNFAQTLKMPKIKADSPEGIKAFEQLEAQRNYEGLGFLGIGGEKYKNNPLEKEAYTFGDNIGQLYKAFIS